MHALFNLMHHFRAVKKWSEQVGEPLAFNPSTFVLEVGRGNRSLAMHPRFSIPIDERRGAYTDVFPERGRFVGWIPYRMKRWGIGTGKLPFKTYCQQSGLRVPAVWQPGEKPSSDYIIKPDKGSFGVGILGPFRAGSTVARVQGDDCLTEQFIPGKACKIWYWNSTPVAYILVDSPYLIGDGRRTIAEIVGQVRGSFDVSYKLDRVMAFLKWQGMSTESIPPDGAKVQLDFLYGHAFERLTLDDPDSLAQQSPWRKAELLHIGRLLHMGVPMPERQGVLYTVDGVIDEQDQLWLLEMNCHTVVHPNAYALILEDWRQATV